MKRGDQRAWSPRAQEFGVGGFAFTSIWEEEIPEVAPCPADAEQIEDEDEPEPWCVGVEMR